MPLYHTMGVRSLLAMALVDGLFVCVRRWNARLALDSIAQSRTHVPVSRADAVSRSARRSELRDDRYVFGHEARLRRRADERRLVEAAAAAFEPELFVNHYGSSEVYTFSIDQDATRKPGSAGRAGHQYALARGEARRAARPTISAAVNEEGQIIADLLGDEAFEGYWNRPDANAKSLRDGWYFTRRHRLFRRRRRPLRLRPRRRHDHQRRREHLAGRYRVGALAASIASTKWRSRA